MKSLGTLAGNEIRAGERYSGKSIGVTVTKKMVV